MQKKISALEERPQGKNKAYQTKEHKNQNHFRPEIRPEIMITVTKYNRLHNVQKQF